ncbi:Amino acid transporter [Giardia duodenalis]|uniref:Amino acid transporter n=1 Tax=Giardia intestinalis TaxID=5741 RepID=V6TDQ7_GIAIN|nr:Amino acid transporter [Giardia intestinalis]
MEPSNTNERVRPRAGSIRTHHPGEKRGMYTNYIGPDLSFSQFEPSSDSEVSFMSDISDQFVVPFEGTASILSSSINLINTISGAGLLALPYTVMRSGWVIGLFSMIFVIVIGSISFYLLSFISDALQVFNYGAIAQKLYNRHVGNLVNILIIALTLGLLMAFTVLIRESMFFFSANPELEWAGQLSLIAVSLVAILPLSLLRNLNSLWLTSLLSIVCLIYFMVMILSFAILSNSSSIINKNIVHPIKKGSPVPVSTSLNLILAVASLSITFCGHYNSLNIYKEVRNKSLTKMKHIIVLVAVVVALLNVTVGLAGYFMFTDQCLPDILLNLAEYPSAHIWSEIADIGIIFVLVFSFPVVCFALRRAVEDAIFQTEYVRRKWSILISLTVVVFTALIGCFVNDVGIVLDLTGMLAGVPLVFIFPAIFTLSFLNPKSHYNQQFSRALRLRLAIEQHEKPHKLLKHNDDTAALVEPVRSRKQRSMHQSLEAELGEGGETLKRYYNNYYVGPVQLAQEKIFRNTSRLKRLRALSWVSFILGVVLFVSALGTTCFISIDLSSVDN